MSLRGFDTDGESFTLTFDGRRPRRSSAAPPTPPPASTPRSRPSPVSAPSTVAASAARHTVIDDTGFEVRLHRGAVAGTDLPALGCPPASATSPASSARPPRVAPSQRRLQRDAHRQPRPRRHAPAAQDDPDPHAVRADRPATDPDGDPLVHLWEQNDRGGAAGTALGSQTKLDGPLFRIFGPYAPVTPAGALQIKSPGENLATSEPDPGVPGHGADRGRQHQRARGHLPVHAAATGQRWRDERPGPGDRVLRGVAADRRLRRVARVPAAGPNTEPSLNFRFTARDLAPDGGGYSYGDVKLPLDKTTGPFRVTSKGATRPRRSAVATRPSTGPTTRARSPPT